jgi:hypothetical protein
MWLKKRGRERSGREQRQIESLQLAHGIPHAFPPH